MLPLMREESKERKKKYHACMQTPLEPKFHCCKWSLDQAYIKIPRIEQRLNLNYLKDRCFLVWCSCSLLSHYTTESFSIPSRSHHLACTTCIFIYRLHAAPSTLESQHLVPPVPLHCRKAWYAETLSKVWLMEMVGDFAPLHRKKLSNQTN